MLKRWQQIQSSFLGNQGEGAKYLGEILTIIIEDKTQFASFFDKILEAEMYQLHEGYFVHLPKALIDDGEYRGDVEISWNNFDDQDHIGLVRLDKFCFYVKLAAIFHAQHVDPDFDPWLSFQKLDEMQKQYFPYSSDNPA